MAGVREKKFHVPSYIVVEMAKFSVSYTRFRKNDVKQPLDGIYAMKLYQAPLTIYHFRGAFRGCVHRKFTSIESSPLMYCRGRGQNSSMFIEYLHSFSLMHK